MTGAATDGWSDFFVAMAGAAAALVGLIVVAMTVTITQILASVALPARAAATIAALTLVVVVSGLGLVPGQGLVAFGLEALVATLASAVFSVVSFVRILQERPRRPAAENTGKIVGGATQLVPFLVGAGLALAGNPAGLGWLAAGILVTFVFSLANAWVLLVEVQR